MNIYYLCAKFWELLGFEQYCPFHIPAEHWRELHPAHHGFRLRHLHYDDAAVPHAQLW